MPELAYRESPVPEPSRRERGPARGPGRGAVFAVGSGAPRCRRLRRLSADVTQGQTDTQIQVLIIVITLVASPRVRLSRTAQCYDPSRAGAAGLFPSSSAGVRRSTASAFSPREPIAKNTRIIDYAGELVRNSQSEAREDRYLADGCIWVFRVNRTWSRDAAVGGNIARFINHACRRTAGSKSSARRSGFARRARSARAKSSPTTMRPSASGPFPAGCRPGCPNKL